ncbi:PTS sugar transporter subunit IIA [Bacillus megaterium]|nr:PTS sugar transporter subunit IIA [Priestia megaterium]
MALAHERAEDGVNEMGLSLLITKETVKFSEKEEHNAQLIFSLVATDSVSHLSLLSDLAQIFSDQANINSLCELRTSEEVLQFISECLGVVE